MASFLVTGGAGFIGTNFVRHWRSHHPRDAIVILDALTYAGNRTNLEGIDGVEFRRGDIRDKTLVAQLLTDHAVDTLIHFAAESHVDRSIHGPSNFIDTNVVGTHTLLMAAKEVWLDNGSGQPHRFHHISTDEVYGSLGHDDPAFTEATPYAPNSPYAASKASSDHLVRAYHCTYGLQVTTTNCSNNYGPYQFPEKLIPFFLVNALHGRPMPIFGDGRHIRDWLHVEDHCRGIELVLRHGRVGECYNIGGRTELTNLRVVEMLCANIDEAFAHDPRLALRFPACPAAHGAPTADLKTFVPDRPGHDRRYAIDPTKAKEELGYAPHYDFAAGLADTVNWYLRNEQWWQPLIGPVADHSASWP